MVESSERVLTPKARRTRERILEAALALFAERGYEATTMRDVAREAGASLGLAYRYFESKEEFGTRGWPERRSDRASASNRWSGRRFDGLRGC